MQLLSIDLHSILKLNINNLAIKIVFILNLTLFRNSLSLYDNLL